MGLFRKAAMTIARGLGLTSPTLYEFLAGGVSTAGRTVSVDSALQLDAVYACVRLISQTISTLPLPLMERNSAGHTSVAVDHPLYRVLHDRPNTEMSAVTFWAAMVASKMLWGNAYAQIVRGVDGRVVALMFMRPDWTQVTRQVDGSLLYLFSWLGQQYVLSEDDVLHIRGFTLDGQMGISAIGMGRNSLGTAIAAETSAGAVFRNGMRPSGYLKAPMFLTKDQREDAKALLTAWKGAENTGVVPLLEGGFDFQSLTIPPEDAQLLETRGFNVETICRWFGVPPVMIGHMSKSTAWGSGLEQMNLWFLTYTLRGHLAAIEQEIWAKCLSREEQDKYFAEFNVEGLLRADSKTRAAFYRENIMTGIMTPNEARAKENMPPLPGGDQLVMQSAMIPLSKLGEIASMPREKEIGPGAALGQAAEGEAGDESKAEESPPFEFKALDALSDLFPDSEAEVSDVSADA